MAKKEALKQEIEVKESQQTTQSESVPAKLFAKTVHLGVGTHLISSKESLAASRGNTLEVTPMGVLAISGKNNRKILIPWANVRAVELQPDPKPQPK